MTLISNCRWRAVAMIVTMAFVFNISGRALAQDAPPAPAPDSATAESAQPVEAPPAPAPAPAPAEPGTAQPAPAGAEEAVPLGPRVPLLIFPLDSQVEAPDSNTLGFRVAKALKDVTLRSTRFDGISYNPKHPTIRRSRDESTLKESDIIGPFGTERDQIDKARRVTMKMEIPFFLVGTIHDFEMNTERSEGQITIDGQIVNTLTGAKEHTWIVTGKSPEAMKVGTPEQFALAATDDAVNQLASRVPGVEPTPDPGAIVVENGTPDPGEEPKVEKKKDNKGWLAVLALALGIAIASGGGGGGDGGGGGVIEDPPAPPF